MPKTDYVYATVGFLTLTGTYSLKLTLVALVIEIWHFPMYHEGEMQHKVNFTIASVGL